MHNRVPGPRRLQRPASNDYRKLIGAIGCSGGTGDQDAAACKAGADLVK
jgi:uncharacterized protein GlcG (DUF336 family)